MSSVKQHKVVASLPPLLEADSIYYVRVGRGFDLYVTNALGIITSYTLNQDKISAPNYETRWPEDPPQPDQVPLQAPSGNFAWWYLPIKTIYYEHNPIHSLTVWMGDAITINGTVTVFPTNTNNDTGNVRFSDIVYGHCMVLPPNGNVESSVLTSIRSIAPDMTTVFFNATTQRNVTLCGQTAVACPDGLTAKVVLIGTPAP